MKRIMVVLRSNGYPLRFIRTSSTRQEQYMPDIRGASDTTQTSSIVLPYIKGISKAIRQILTPCVHSAPQDHIQTSPSPEYSLSMGQRLCTPRTEVWVVYHIPCFACPESYLGQMGRSLMHRVKEHKSALATGNCLTSAAAEHAMTTNHAIDWDRATVITTIPIPPNVAC